MKGQVWIETVLYTLIGLAIMGVILSLVKPSLDEKRDQLVLNQVIEILEGIDDQVEDVVYRGEGNSRPLEITLKKGSITIDGVNDIVVFSMDSKNMFSEIGSVVSRGKIKALTTEKANKLYNVALTLDYSNFNITFAKTDVEKVLQYSSTPYRIIIANNGRAGSRTNIDFSIV